MSDGYPPPWADQTIGADRDAETTAERLIQGASVIVAGPTGSGKSHFLRAVAHALHGHDVTPVLVRSAAPLSGTPYGALDACPDGRAADLRPDSDAADRPRAVVIVDDINHLDAESAEAVIRSVYADRASTLIALTVPRTRGNGESAQDDATIRLVVDLWLRGFADRIDLAELDSQDAEALLDTIDGSDLLDAVTRASLVWRSDRSRLLLRELGSEAVHAVRMGRDPLQALIDTSPHSRASHALAAHAMDLSEAEREALAFVHRVPRIAFADATRFIAPSTLNDLMSAALMHADSSISRRLTASRSIARAAERELGTVRVDALIDAASVRMIDAGGRWWSTPLAIATAGRWHHRGAAPHAIESAPVEIGQRVALEAAQRANDTGEPAGAAAYAALGLQLADSVALEVERGFAMLMLSAGTDSASLDSLDLSSLDGETLRRYLSFQRDLISNGMTAQHVHTPGLDLPAGAVDEAIAAQLELAAADTATAQLDWESAAAHADAANVRDSADALTRLRAGWTAGLAHANLGRWDRAKQSFDRVDRMLSGRTTPATIETQERLGALGAELIAHQVVGADGSLLVERVRTEREVAVRENDPGALAHAGVASAIAFSMLGLPDRALLELERAVSRRQQVTAGPGVVMLELDLAEALALAERPAEARRLYERADHRDSPYLSHAVQVACSAVFIAEGRLADAAQAARDAATISARFPYPPTRARDIFRLLILDAATPEEYDELRHYGESFPLPITTALAERAVTLRAENAPVHALAELRRTRTTWTVPATEVHRLTPTDGARTGKDGGGRTDPRASQLAVSELTRREREIALLVDQGMSNREIAGRLFLSVRTVESHIYQARTKVGARSRADLGSLVTRWAASRKPSSRA